MLNGLKEVFKDVDGNFSSKRVVTLVAMLLVSIAFIANMFFGVTINQPMYNGLLNIVMIGTGFIGLEKFSKLNFPLKANNNGPPSS